MSNGAHSTPSDLRTLINPIGIKPSGFVHTEAKELPRHWSVSDVEGTLLPEAVDLRPHHLRRSKTHRLFKEGCHKSGGG